MITNSRCSTEFIQELFDEVETCLKELAVAEPDQRPMHEQEQESIRSKKKGWTQTLANADLAECIRREIESEWEAAENRLAEIETELAALDATQIDLSQQITHQDIQARLDRLADILAKNDPTSGNLELSLHIDRIGCNAEGNVQLRMCKLGVLPEAIDLLAITDGDPNQSEGDNDRSTKKSGPRRRGRSRVDSLAFEDCDRSALLDFAADTDRFAAVPEDWFWVDSFQVPGKKPSWAEENASRVGELRKQGMTIDKIASELNVSIPTIRNSLGFATKADPDLANLPQKMSRARWHEDHALEVAKVKAEEGLGTNALVERFGKSDTTIRKALEHARQLALSAATP